MEAQLDDYLALAETSPASHFGTCVEILDKSNELIHPKPNILQERMSAAYEACMILGIPCRMVVVKPRQVGCSTFATHIGYHHCQQRRITGIVISDLTRNSQKLLEKVRDYQYRDKYPWPNKMHEKAGVITWSNGSELVIDSAENPKAGIGQTRQFAHVSEIGKWQKSGAKQDKKLMEALLPSISKKPGTVVIAESTPEGASGWLYDTYAGGREKSGALFLDDFIRLYTETGEVPGNGWIKVFAGWFEFSEHTHPVNEYQVEKIKTTLSDRETDGITKYGWTWGQLAWRRFTIANETSGEEAFDEYYPEDDHRCWLVSGRPRFSMTAISAMERDSSGIRPERGFLNLQDNDSVTWSASREGAGDIEIYERPKQDCRYLVSCDPATGADQTESKDPDNHSVLVFRAPYATETGLERPTKLVARVRPPFQGESDLVANHIVNLSLFYGRCLVCLEVNMGLHILELIRHRGLPLYHRDVANDMGRGKSRKIGFKLKDANLRLSLIHI